MITREVENKQQWDDFVQAQPFSLFVQSSKYIDFYKKMGENGFVVGVYENEELIGGSVVVTTHAKRGNFLYLPYGPVIKTTHTDKIKKILQSITEYLVQYASQNAYNFLRVSPFLEDTNENKQAFKTSGYREAPMHILAENTWILDVSPSEEELLKVMNKNHRNLIRRCATEGVKIEMKNAVIDLKDLDSLLDITAKRHKFKRFSQNYIEKEFSVYAEDNQAVVFNAYLPDGRLDASAIIMFYGNMAAYRHSASLNLDKRLPTSYLLQWQVIQEAKKRGIQWYNFWGIAPEGAGKEHPFYGITHFKKGFGGFKHDVVHCQDYPVKPLYWMNWTIETLRRVKRGF